jgi:hypothetical protein
MQHGFDWNRGMAAYSTVGHNKHRQDNDAGNRPTGFDISMIRYTSRRARVKLLNLGRRITVGSLYFKLQLRRSRLRTRIGQ